MDFDLMHTCREKKQPLLIISGGVFLLIYLTLIYGGKFGYINQQPIIKIILLALIIASTSALLAILLYTSLSRLKHFHKPIKHADVNINTISASELFEICDNLCNELHSLIEELLPLPDFDSDYIDESIQQISRSRIAPCTAYSYGIVTLCISTKYPMFFQSTENNSLQSYVLNSMLTITKETNEITGLGNVPNQEISNIVSKDIKHILYCIDYYKKTNSNNDDNPLAKFIVFLSKRISKDLLKNTPKILNFTKEKINKTTLLVNKL